MREVKKIKMVDACDLITCGVAARPKYVETGIPFLSAKNVKEGTIIYNGYNCITEENHRELTKKNKPLKGDILYTRVGSYGEAAVIEQEVEFSIFVSLTLIKPKRDLLNSYYLKYYLNSHEVKSLAQSSITSSGVGNLNVGTVRKFPVPIPPLSEQEQVVSLLDQAFTAIDQAKANLEKNIENAKELFQSKLNEIFSQKGEGWEEKKLKEVCDGFNYGSSSKSLSEGKIAVLRMGNIQDGKLDWTSLKYSNDEEEITKYLLTKNDVLFNRTNSAELVGKSAIYKDEAPAIFAGYLIRVRGKKDKLSNDFLNYYLNSKKTLEYGYSVMSSSVNQANINASKLKQYVIRLPKYEEQEILVEELNKLKSEVDELIKFYGKKSQALEELKKSLLQKAFVGELTKKEVEA